MKFPGLITKGTGFKNRKKLKINWGTASMIWGTITITAIIIFTMQFTPPINDPGQDTPQSPEPGSSGDLLVFESIESYDELLMSTLYDQNCPHVTYGDGVLRLGPPLPLPPISLQQIYYDPFTSKLWYIDDDMIPHEITVMVEVDIGIGFDHEWQAAVGVGGIE